MKELIGHKIRKIFISDDKEELQFLNDRNEILIFQASGDCCNSVWFEHISGIDAILGSTIKEFASSIKGGEWKEVPATPGLDEFEEAGFFTLITDKGHCTIEVRNNHNGYYGGEVCFRGKYNFVRQEILGDI